MNSAVLFYNVFTVYTCIEVSCGICSLANHKNANYFGDTYLLAFLYIYSYHGLLYFKGCLYSVYMNLAALQTIANPSCCDVIYLTAQHVCSYSEHGLLTGKRIV